MRSPLTGLPESPPQPLECPLCEGSKFYTEGCPWCEDTGHAYSGPVEGNCRSCKGSGIKASYPCPVCDGEGEIDVQRAQELMANQEGRWGEYELMRDLHQLEIDRIEELAGSER